MLVEAGGRCFKPSCALFDSWYPASNLKLLMSLGWQWLTRLKANRLVDPDGGGHVPVRDLEILSEGLVVHLKGYGLVRVFRAFSRDEEAEH